MTICELAIHGIKRGGVIMRTLQKHKKKSRTVQKDREIMRTIQKEATRLRMVFIDRL